MPIEFELYPNPQQEGENSPCYHARVVNNGCVDSSLLAEEIEKENSLTQSDVKATLIALSQKLSEHLGKGERVHLEGIGYFQVTLSCDQKMERPSLSRKNEHIHFKSVSFRADNQLKSQLQSKEIVHSNKGCHSANLNPEDVDSILINHFKNSPFLTRRIFQDICKITISTACRMIKQLILNGKLKNISSPNQPIYVPGENLALQKVENKKKNVTLKKR